MERTELRVLCRDAARLRRRIARVGDVTRYEGDPLSRFHDEVTPEVVLDLLDDSGKRLEELTDRLLRAEKQMEELLVVAIARKAADET